MPALAPEIDNLKSGINHQCETKTSMLVEIGKRVFNTKVYLDELSKIPGFDPENDIFNYSVMKNYSKEPSPREVGDKGWLDKPQPTRTDLESAGCGSGTMPGKIDFVDVEIDE